jgi:hypothetical protein
MVCPFLDPALLEPHIFLVKFLNFELKILKAVPKKRSLSQLIVFQFKSQPLTTPEQQHHHCQLAIFFTHPPLPGFGLRQNFWEP